MKSMKIKKWMRVTAAAVACALLASVPFLSATAFLKKDVINGWHPYGMSNLTVQNVNEESFKITIAGASDQSKHNYFLPYTVDSSIWKDGYVWPDADEDDPLLVPGDTLSADITVENTGDKAFTLYLFRAKTQGQSDLLSTFSTNNPLITWNSPDGNDGNYSAEKLLAASNALFNQVKAKATVKLTYQQGYDDGLLKGVEDGSKDDRETNYWMGVTDGYREGFHTGSNDRTAGNEELTSYHIDDGLQTDVGGEYKASYAPQYTGTDYGADYKNGFEAGYETGYDKGYQYNYQNGYKYAYGKGYDDGFAGNAEDYPDSLEGLEDYSLEPGTISNYQTAFEETQVTAGSNEATILRGSKAIGNSEPLPMKVMELGTFSPADPLTPGSTGTKKSITVTLTIPASLTNLPQNMSTRASAPLPSSPMATVQPSVVPLANTPSRGVTLPVNPLTAGSSVSHPHGFGGTVGLFDFIFVAYYKEDSAAPQPDPDPDPTPDPTPPPVPKTGDAAIPYTVAAIACAVSGTACLVFAFLPNRRRKEHTA